jgi:DnaJ-class molecular chaperone
MTRKPTPPALFDAMPEARRPTTIETDQHIRRACDVCNGKGTTKVLNWGGTCAACCGSGQILTRRSGAHA